MRRLTSLAADASCGCARNLMRHDQTHRRASETVGLLAMPVTVKLRRPGMTEVGPLLPNARTSTQSHSERMASRALPACGGAISGDTRTA